MPWVKHGVEDTKKVIFLLKPSTTLGEIKIKKNTQVVAGDVRPNAIGNEQADFNSATLCEKLQQL